MNAMPPPGAPPPCRNCAEQRAPRADWQGRFEWDAEALRVLRDVFGLSAFRQNQREVVNATMQARRGHPALALHFFACRAALHA